MPLWHAPAPLYLPRAEEGTHPRRLSGRNPDARRHRPRVTRAGGLQSHHRAPPASNCRPWLLSRTGARRLHHGLRGGEAASGDRRTSPAVRSQLQGGNLSQTLGLFTSNKTRALLAAPRRPSHWMIRRNETIHACETSSASSPARADIIHKGRRRAGISPYGSVCAAALEPPGVC